MQIPKITSASMINNISSVQTNHAGDFAERLAHLTDNAQSAKDDAKLKKTCKDMEAMFLNMMLTNMRKTIQKSKLVDSSQEEVMTSMLDSEMTKKYGQCWWYGIG